MEPWMIWAGAAALYAAFRLWYDNWRGPLTPAEIEAFIADASSRTQESGNDINVLRAFLEADDGREFVMLNLLRVHPNEVDDPETGGKAKGIDLLSRYSRSFMGVLFKKGGHPGVVARKVGGYIDAWNTAPDPGMTLFGLMRYRSRRDMIRLSQHPSFREAHPLKIAGTDITYSFPTQKVMGLYAGPRVTVALGLALAAAIGHIFIT